MGPWHLKILTQYSLKDLKAVKNVDVVLSLSFFHSGTICVGNQFTAVAWLRWSNYFNPWAPLPSTLSIVFWKKCLTTRTETKWHLWTIAQTRAARIVAALQQGCEEMERE